MKNFTQKFIGLLAVVFTISFTINAQDNYSLNLDGVGDHVVVNPSLSLDTISSFSIGGWFNIRSIPSGAWNPSLLAKLNTDGNLDSELNVSPEGFALQLLTETFDPSYHYSFFLMTKVNGQDRYLNVVSESTFLENEWTHIMCTYSNGNAKIFINGVLNNESNWQYDLTIPDNQFFTIGADIDDLSTNGEMGVSYTDIPITLDGSVDDVLFYNIELSSEQIQSLMSCGPSQEEEEGLVGYWDFNQLNEDLLIDISGNGNNGIIHGGATYSEDVPEQDCENLIDTIITLEGYTYIGELENSIYYISNDISTWEEANEIAANLGGHLVTISSEEENQFIWNAVYNQGYNPGGTDNYQAWIGLYQNTESNSYQEPSGGWQWVNGEEFSYSNWASDEPDNNDGGYFAHISDSNCPLNGGPVNNVCGTWCDDTISSNLTSAFHIIEYKYGCTDSEASNYDETLSLDDGSCQYSEEVSEIEEEQQNYSMSFSENDGIFIEPIFGGVQNDFSISATVKPNGSETWGSIFLSRSHYNDTYLNIQKYPSDTSIIKVRFFASYLQDNNVDNEVILWGDVDLNQWNNIVGTYNGETIKLYVNGELVDSSPASGEVDWSNNCWTSIGGDGNYSTANCSGGYTSIEGNINNLHVWNKPLSQSEIQNNMNCAPSGDEEGLVGYWDFNEGSGDTVYDISGNGNHGTIHGAQFIEDVPEHNCDLNTDIETVEEEQHNYSMSFDGEDDYIEIVESIEMSNSFAIQAKIKTHSLFGQQVIYAKSNTNFASNTSPKGYMLNINNGKLCFFNRSNDGSNNYDVILSSNVLPINEWQHISCVGYYDNTNSVWVISLYLNGENIITETIQQIASDFENVNSYVSRWYNGSVGFTEEFYFDGEIDNIQIWEKELSLEEIQSYNICPPTGDEEGIVGFWDFNEGTGDTLYDISGNNNHGSIYGATFSEDVPEHNCDLNTDIETVDEEQQNYSMSFDGIDDYVELLHPPFDGIQNSFSIISQFQLNQVLISENEFEHCIYGHRGNYQDVQVVVDDGKIRFNIFNTTSNMLNLITSSSFDPLQWVNVIATYDGNSAKIYIDGELDTMMTINLGDIDWNNNGIHGYWIGGGDPSWNPYTDGKINYLLFKDYALTESEIENYNCLNFHEEGVAALWNFNEGSGDTVYDISGNGNHGIIYGASYSEDVPEQNCDLNTNIETIEEEQHNYSMSFDGVDDWIDVGFINGMNAQESHTFLFYTKNLEAPCDHGNIISETGPPTHTQMLHYGFRGCASNCPEGNCMGMDYYGNGLFSPTHYGNEWGFWALIYNSVTSERKIYFNGELISSDYNISQYLGDFDMMIGAGFYTSNNSVGDFYKGILDDLSLWNIELSHEQILSYMNCSSIGDADGLLGYWNFNEGSGDTVYDISGNGNHGIINGEATFSHDVPETNCIEGCIDSSSVNYNNSANIDDGSCLTYEEFIIDSLQQALAVFETVEEDLSNANDSIDELVSDLGIANDSISSLETDLELSEESLLNAYDSIDILTSDLGLVNDSIFSLETDLELSEESLLNAYDSIDILISDLSLANDSISSLETDLELSEENLLIANNSIDVLTSDLVLANDSITSLELEISLIQSDISLLESQLDSTINQLTQIQLDLEASINDVIILGDSITSLNEFITSLQEQLSIAMSNQEDGIGQADVDSAYNEGASIGEEYGYSQGYNEGYNQGNEDGESYGYTNGFEEGVASVIPEDGINQADIDFVQNLLDEANSTISNLNSSLNTTNSTIAELEEDLLVAMSNQEDGISQADRDAVQILLDEANNLTFELNNSLALANLNITELEEQLSACLENQTQVISIDLIEGWNIIGYTLYEPQDAAASFVDITNELQLVKNNTADVYWPEFGFNGIGDLIPGQGYQVRVTSNILNFTYPNVGGQRIELVPTVPQWVIDMEVDIHPNDIRTLVKVVNMLGQEVDPQTEPKGTVLIYLYNDATVEKKIVK